MEQQYYKDLIESEKLMFNTTEKMFLDCLPRDRAIIILDMLLKKFKGELK